MRNPLPSLLESRRRRAGVAAAVAAVAAGGAAFAYVADEPQRAGAARPVSAAAKPPPPPEDDLPPIRPRPRVVQALPPGEAPPPEAESSTGGGRRASRPPSDAEVREELSDFRALLAEARDPRSVRARVLPDGTATIPRNAPDVVAAVVAAGNEIATKPYIYGGGHGAWRDRGYDCSGSVSFALAGAGLLDRPLASGPFMKWGEPGPGKWITIYANPGHMFMVVAGLRFDTSGARGGTRWQRTSRSTAGLVARHPPGL